MSTDLPTSSPRPATSVTISHTGLSIGEKMAGAFVKRFFYAAAIFIVWWALPVVGTYSQETISEANRLFASWIAVGTACMFFADFQSARAKSVLDDTLAQLAAIILRAKGLEDRGKELEESLIQLKIVHGVLERVNTRHTEEMAALKSETTAPIPMRIHCPARLNDGSICGALHVDEGDFATKSHHTHSCQTCGHTWRPAVVATVGARFLPGFKNEETPAPSTTEIDS